jgi:alkanesulfonate monooxygenase SsuD/methylene tetrahydromethanopterin reductase-like flavin-dependent oxidoreductase (luciferase family)
MWMQETFAHRGRCFSMPERAVLPKPLQKPHPPMWVTVTSPGTEIDAADRGLGCLGVATASYAEQERRTREYHRRIQLCDPVGAAVNDRVAILNFLYCHEDARAAAEHGLRFLGTFGILNAHLLFTREVYPTSAYQSLANLAPAPSQKGGPGDRPSVPDGICIGDPHGIIQAAKRWESIGVDQINVLLNASEVLTQDQVLASLRLFAKEVMPVFEC